MMPEVPMCCLRLHGVGADTLLIQCKITKSHIRAALEILTDTRWSSEFANVADRGVSVHTPIHPIFNFQNLSSNRLSAV